MYCKGCGKEIKDGTKFCPYCGTAQAATASAKCTAQFAEKPQQVTPLSATAEMRPKKRKRGLIVLLLVLVLLAALAAVGYRVVWPWWQEKQDNVQIEGIKEETNDTPKNNSVAQEILPKANENVSDRIKTDLVQAYAEIEHGDYSEAENYMKVVSEKSIKEHAKTVQGANEESSKERLYVLGKSYYSGGTLNEVSFAWKQDEGVVTAWYRTDGTSGLNSTDFFDENGNLTKSTSEFTWARKQVWAEELYDEDGNEETSIMYTEDRQTIINQSDWTFYENGNKKTWHQYEYDSDSGLIRNSDWTYNENGNVLTANSSDSDGYELQMVWTYDRNGNMLSKSEFQKYSNGQTTTYKTENTFDQYGNVITRIETKESGGQTITLVKESYTYTYDNCGNLIEGICRDESNAITKRWTSTFDTSGNEIAHKEDQNYEDHSSNWFAVYDSVGNQTARTDYNDDGNISKENYYDSEGNLIESIEYDENGEITAHTKRNYSEGYLTSEEDVVEDTVLYTYYVSPNVLLNAGD